MVDYYFQMITNKYCWDLNIYDEEHFNMAIASVRIVTILFDTSAIQRLLQKSEKRPGDIIREFENRYS